MREKQTVLKERFVKVSFFALDFEMKMPYPLPPPQGWEVHFGSLKIELLATSNWQLAKPTPKPFNHKVEKPIFISLRGPKALDDKGHPFDFAQGRLRNTKELGEIAEVYANLESPGMASVKPFGILDDAWGEGCYRLKCKQRAVGIADIARHRRDRKNKKPTTEARRHGEQPRSEDRNSW